MNLAGFPNVDAAMLGDIAELSQEYAGSLGKYIVIAIVVGTIISLIIDLFGLKVIRVLNVITGIGVGAAVGAAIVFLANLEMPKAAIAVIAATVICTLLFAFVKKLGAFFYILATFVGAGLSFFMLDSMILCIACLAAALVLAILGMIFFEPIVIIVTSIVGGIGVANGVLYFVEDKLPNPNLKYAVFAGAILIGMLVQFLMKSGEVRRRDKKAADEIRAKHSVENDVDLARTVLDIDLDGEDDDMDYAPAPKKAAKKKVAKKTVKKAAKKKVVEDVVEPEVYEKPAPEAEPIDFIDLDDDDDFDMINTDYDFDDDDDEYYDDDEFDSAYDDYYDDDDFEEFDDDDFDDEDGEDF